MYSKGYQSQYYIMLKKDIRLSSNRNFGIVFFLFFLAISLWPLTSNESVKIWFLAISMIFLFLGLINSNLLLPLNRLWFQFGLLLGNIIAPIVMGIIYFLIVTPTGLILRIFNKDILNLNRNKKIKSYWVEKDKKHSSMRNQF